MTNQITVCWRKCFIPSSSNNKNLSSTAFLQPGASDFFKPQLGAPVCKHRQPRDPVLEDCEFQPEPETPVCSQPQPGTQVWDGAFPTESRGAGCNSLQRQSPSVRLSNQQIPSPPAEALKVFQLGSICSQEIRLGRAASFLQSQDIRFACSHEMVFSAS